MRALRSRLQMLGAVAIAAALVWGSGTVAAALPQSERLHAGAHSAPAVDYATDVVAPGSRFIHTRPTYDQ
ncbi:MAG: hypothetical protein AUH76_12320 [Candidatus Rokubacteria bacterium 13_1_40CM_4_67_11]|nr:MAG: hypothetical protein AUH76_12320 [Candidatus Rokubacteria bacterium 13_1_40CM_4_67_11]